MEAGERWWGPNDGVGYQRPDCFLFSPRLPLAMSVKMAFYCLGGVLWDDERDKPVKVSCDCFTSFKTRFPSVCLINLSSVKYTSGLMPERGFELSGYAERGNAPG